MSEWDDARRAVCGAIRSVPDFPQPGILFRDITPLLGSPTALEQALAWYADRCAEAEVIAGIEARGFIFGAALAARLGLPFAPLRKPGKLPAATIGRRYELEYGVDGLEMHTDAVRAGQRVAVVDDVLATGGTLEAAVRLLDDAEVEVVRIAALIELVELKGRERLAGRPLDVLVRF